ncbi:MAG TPA: FtsQ-type POTRA domain-containing protein [Sphingomonadaceae bacterium]|nr:FtsQ-type POTRA domain-containing protein [Sphingomonadaceae bacterium]
MSQTIRRKARGVRRTAAAQSKARRARSARARTGSFLDWLVRILPFTERQLQNAFLAMILGGGVALAWFVASLAGVPAMAGRQVAQLSEDAGFVVRNIELRGTERLNEDKVYQLALGQQRPMPLVDLEALRQELLELSWVKDARVSRRLPDSIVIDIVERKPHAVMRKPGRYVLIDATGAELEPIAESAALAYLVIEGPGAGNQVAALDRLLEATPALRDRIDHAEWVGNRRWNLTFDTDQVLALPEGGEEAADALVKFARLEGMNQLLAGQATAFDMRVAGRIAMRIPGRSEARSLSTAEEGDGE